MTDTTTRNAGLRHMLSMRRREMQNDVQGRIRDGRNDRANEVRDELEHSDADSQGEIELALLQMRAATLTRIDEALVRIDAGEYGYCLECAREISEQRLRALPFAVRCRACEETRELEQTRARLIDQRRDSVSILPDFVRA
jgi:DnaK suppressor protein